MAGLDRPPNTTAREPVSITGRFVLQQVRRRMNLADAEPVALGPDRRYVLDRSLGRGAMGVVFLARDTELEREIALKVVSSYGHGAEGLRELLRTEAKTLAKVRHPNVVEVYDVARADSGELFLTMSYIRGQTLAQWQRGRPVRAIIHKYEAAARGLAAAHAAGVIHRDFKPNNVLIEDPSDSAFVIDFGLAWTPERLMDPALSSDVESGRSSSNSTLRGTLPYAAPELLDGSSASPASDQYAFCVALWQGVTGELPFDPSTREPDAAVPERHEQVPRWLHRILKRGLARDPGERFATMTALVAELERGLDQRVRTRWGLAGVALGLVVVASAIDLMRVPIPTRSSCVAAGAVIEEVWNDEARAAVRHALVDADSEGVWATTFAIDAFETAARQWREASLASCESLVHAPYDHQAMVERACLDARLEYFRDALAQIERLGPDSAAALHHILEPLSESSARCALPRPLVHERARTILAELRVEVARRNYARAIELATAELDRTPSYAEPCADASESSVERGELLFALARLYGDQDHPREALAYLDRVDLDARSCDHRELLARSNIERAQVLALDLGDADTAERWLDAGVAGYRQLGGFGDQEPEVHEARALIELTRGHASGEAKHYRGAIEHYNAAIAALPDNPSTRPQEAKLLVNIGAAWHELDDYEQAERSYRSAITRLSETLGPDHPETRARRARAIYNLGVAATAAGDEARGAALIAELEQLDEAILAVQVQTMLLRHLYGNDDRLKDALAQADALASALAQIDSLPLRAQASAHTVIGQVFAYANQAQSLTHLQRALRLWEKLPDASSSRDVCELNYAEALANMAERDLAEQHLRALFARFDGATQPKVRRGAVDLARRLELSLSNDDEIEASDAPHD